MCRYLVEPEIFSFLNFLRVWGAKLLTVALCQTESLGPSVAKPVCLFGSFTLGKRKKTFIFFSLKFIKTKCVKISQMLKLLAI